MELSIRQLKKLIEEKSELAQRASEAYNQLQGQIALLRDMYQNTKNEELAKKTDKKDKEVESGQEEEK